MIDLRLHLLLGERLSSSQSDLANFHEALGKNPKKLRSMGAAAFRDAARITVLETAIQKVLEGASAQDIQQMSLDVLRIQYAENPSEVGPNTETVEAMYDQAVLDAWSLVFNLAEVHIRTRET